MYIILNDLNQVYNEDSSSWEEDESDATCWQSADDLPGTIEVDDRQLQIVPIQPKRVNKVPDCWHYGFMNKDQVWEVLAGVDLRGDI